MCISEESFQKIRKKHSPEILKKSSQGGDSKKVQRVVRKREEKKESATSRLSSIVLTRYDDWPSYLRFFAIATKEQRKKLNVKAWCYLANGAEIPVEIKTTVCDLKKFRKNDLPYVSVAINHYVGNRRIYGEFTNSLESLVMYLFPDLVS